MAEVLMGTLQDNLVKAIRITMDEKTFIDPAVAGRLVAHVMHRHDQPATAITAKLTEREVDVLRLIASGYNNTAIAQRLHFQTERYATT